MKKIISLIKACMTDNMSLFKIKNNKGSKASKIILPIFLFIICFFYIWSYANIFMEPLTKIHLEYILLSIFVFFTFILTLVEGIYKSSTLLFNCKDDNLLFSLPIKKSTVLFVRIFKFYVFELLYNSLFILPAMIVYIRYVHVGISYYIVSLFMLLLLPIIPIIISCLIGGLISITSSKFKYKNIAQILFTTILLLIILYVSFNLQNIIKNIATNASSINEIITKIYYPAGAYVKMITNFNIIDLLLFIFINISLFILTIVILSKRYFKTNSKVKEVHTTSKNTNYIIKYNKPIISLIKKELSKFSSSPVFVTNAGFGLVLFIIGCILLVFKFDSVINSISSNGLEININDIKSYLPIILFGFICFTSFTTSITSSMISLEGKSFNILKSLPIKPFTIILSKVITAILIMIPLILIGDTIVFIKFNFNILEMLMIIIASILLPLISETLGILVNLKYPKMNAENDTEVVKQSMSSMVSVFAGMVLSGFTIFILVTLVKNNMPNSLILLLSNLFYVIIYILLLIYMNKVSVKEFNSINV